MKGKPMTNQFKFGDLVRCEYYRSIGVIIGVSPERRPYLPSHT